ncbi:hypothetical protein BDK92_5190 [Micromonospora pisi]|uniref:Uncharacterized protein n=1 Tax=Micromonospora pisi TaxID=589240 RepID=A0A495JQK3_9ACTN|nr:hypothetical protein [Micromonospora pisi]RKR90808.1 hypothetical protein BDK92_5190 [Micromonospora pisi]
MEQPSEIAVELPRAWDKPVVTLPVLACLSLVGGQLHSFSLSANLFTLGTGGALIWLGLTNRLPRRPHSGRPMPGTVWWVLPVAVFAVFEGATFVLGSGDDFPTFSRLADPLLNDELIRSAAYFGWLAAFWALVRR